MKKAIISILVFCMCGTVLWGCAKKTAENNGAADSTQEYVDVLASKTKKFITEDINPTNHNVRISYTYSGLSGTEEDKVFMEMGMTGKDYYLESKSVEVGHTLIVLKGDILYSVLHDTKTTVIEKSIDTNEYNNPLNIVFDVNTLDFSSGDIAKGEATLQGKTYNYEEFSVMDQQIRFMYEGDVCKAVTVKENGIETVLLVNYYDSNVDMDKFSIPSGYKTEDYR